MQPLRYVILGAGGVAHGHVESYNKQPDVSVAGFLDSNLETLERWKKRFPQAETETDAARLLAKTKPDFAAVCAPNVWHAELTKAALAAGCHVMCEKPMAMTAAEARGMEAARAAAGKAGAINFSYRNVAAFRFAREVIRAGELGTIQRMNVRYLQSFFAGESTPFTWRNDIKLAGFGALGDLGVHMLDGVGFVTGLAPRRIVGLMKTLLGPRPDAQGHLRPITTDTNAAFLTEYENGAVGAFETSQCIPGYGNFFNLEISGDKGLLRICSEDSDNITLYAGAALSRYSTWNHENFPKISVPSDFAGRQPKSTMESFVKLIRGERVECASFADGVRAQCCLEALVESLRTGAWAKVQDG